MRRQHLDTQPPRRPQHQVEEEVAAVEGERSSGQLRWHGLLARREVGLELGLGLGIGLGLGLGFGMSSRALFAKMDAVREDIPNPKPKPNPNPNTPRSRCTLRPSAKARCRAAARATPAPRPPPALRRPSKSH